MVPAGGDVVVDPVADVRQPEAEAVAAEALPEQPAEAALVLAQPEPEPAAV